MPENLYIKFINDFSNVMCKLADGNQYSNIIFLCIGTDRITGDTFGPLVGRKLKSLFQNTRKINVIGDLKNPVCANNILETADFIRENFSNPFILAIDSALSSKDNIGTINVSEGPVSLRNEFK